MIKFYSLILFVASFSFSLQAQLNCVLESNVDFTPNVNDIWGYSSGGAEYAIIGLQNGVNIQDISNPASPIDKGTASGQVSTWRDIKTYSNYAYVTNDNGQGMMLIDLSGLAAGPITSADYSNWKPYIAALGDTLERCHNIYIDDSGYAYLAGCNLNNGGIIYVDLFTDPANPAYVGHGPAIYSHDVYVDGTKMYTSDIYAGEFSIYDITNLPAAVLLGSQQTPNTFTHNTWSSGDIIFTTDERSNAFTAAYDISDPTAIEFLDAFQPLASANTGVVPHNVHVINNYLVISHYSDGVIIVDALDPENLIEVGNYDTYPGALTGGRGAWGAYPFLPSGNIIVSDRQTGLYVLSPTYVRAARLEGQITDMNTGSPIPNATIVIGHPQTNSGSTNFNGDFKTGIEDAGTFTITISAPGYITKTVSATIVNGVATILNEVLESEPLALELTYFEVEKILDNSAKLKWGILTDHEDLQFEIERSVDGIQFEKIIEQTERALLTEENHFTFIDDKPLEGKNYYRIKAFDIDRSFSYSNIASLTIGSTIGNQISIFPNPIQDDEYLNITVPKTSKSLSVTIYNALGAVLISGELQANSNNKFSKSLMSKGLNLVVIESAAGVVKVEKVVN